ncbi:SDR family NAD(P)-dependent oxidoreductase [Haliscomenobacter hydrossis]|uniref:3-oxoacyl-(Acyl-carrier-protein) reductase n=1 Tax=Haliscomenobacter hydrossis (strain ATCC 27775 / DSM 1100 / LMG 10767 / O) TaxID=760192 RepID=F4KSZ8_HALH1|nr:SDR family oxidoreductase [Haliscomenobacter hydrossis]AEE49105.1 3-oxoacyl-(acyl-carrier-protein) reductase [Haliscomenobacter hydrossis DSM 1100]
MSNHYLVVGGSHGIGLEITRKLIQQGHRVTVFSRTADGLADLSGVEHHVLDLSKDEISPELIPADLHGLVYCPGSINLRAFSSLSPSAFRDDLEINLIGAVKSIQAGLKALKKTPGSSIVLFSTVAVGQGMPFHSSVAASKGAVEGLTRALAAELAPGIRVNCIAPSLTDTPLAARLLSSEEKREAAANRHPLKKVGTANELAALATFLLSADAAWITGQVIHADGGMSSVRV